MRTTSSFHHQAQMIRYLVLAVTFVATSVLTLQAQRSSVGNEFYIGFSFNAEERPVFCTPLDSPLSTVHSIAVLRDEYGRPTQITRLFFGNIDDRRDWSILKLRYDTLKPTGSVLMRRTWHSPSGIPAMIDIAYGEDVLYDSTGRLLMVTRLDSAWNRLERVNAVTRSLYSRAPGRDENAYVQEWRYSNNKQYYGEGYWPTEMQFSPLDKEAWFRRFTVDSLGNLLSEVPLGLDKKPVPFPTGEPKRIYRRDACGAVLEVSFSDLNDKPFADADGVIRIEFDYDAAGRLIEWRSFGADGAPRGRSDYNGAARMTRSYRAFDGYLLGEQFFDAAGGTVDLADSAAK